MKLIIFGATGGVGQALLQQTLAANLEVTAFVRTPAKVQLTHENLTVVQGDAFNQADVTAAIAGHDAVVSCLGSSNGMKPSTELQEMTQNIVTGMQANGVKRIVYVASAGVHRELTGIMGKLMMLLLKNALTDHRAAVEAITQTNLNFTIVRPMGLTDKDFTGEYRESETSTPAKSSTIPRADVAHFILKALLDASYDRKSIGLAT
ncbi:NAD(P)H-binding protein [Aerococcaceae bacterium DSM 109653]|uniref:NAD(P)H-binding protein n=1 Tax=Fundicoccus ignavus TaxID=2664442 RepID=A0A844C1J3_9LACT|nr:NAD(P)-binding oxidoreductase [Fundicoccus ignavus]MRI82576.1 NAD(P)H-binding protein [Fundicoccus ignavus]